MNESLLTVQVECGPGAVPRRFWLGDQVVEIEEILDRWFGADHRYFKVRARGSDTYILRHDVTTDEWVMTLFRRGG